MTQSVILVGPPASGKTRYGARVATMLGLHSGAEDCDVKHLPADVEHGWLLLCQAVPRKFAHLPVLDISTALYDLGAADRIAGVALDETAPMAYITGWRHGN